MSGTAGWGALNGVRVMEFTVVLAGPVCGMLLAQMGADVVKIEPPMGDPQRRNGSVVPGESKHYQAYNHGKRSLVVDLREERGRELIHRIIPQFDVVLTNYRPGVAARLGIDYETLRQYRPDLVYLEMNAFGFHGPEAPRAGSDVVVQAYAGLIAGGGQVDEDGAPRSALSIALADHMTGAASAMGIAAALYHRAQTGEGQLVRGSLLRSTLFAQGSAVMREPVTDASSRDVMMAELEAIRERGGDYAEQAAAHNERRGLGAGFNLYYGGYQAQDGGLFFGALSPAGRDTIRRAVGAEAERSDDPDYDVYDAENIAEAREWKRTIQERISTKTAAEWRAILDEAGGAPVSQVQFAEEMSDDTHVQAEGMIWDIEHEITGPQRVVGPIVEMEGTPTRVPHAAPPLGRHTHEILEELGVGAEDRADLLEAGVIRDHTATGGSRSR